ncbi:MAG: hypothetical protein H0W25_08045 [Acidimicrobiia bacterium]|nr:hypothetical protein [Acidimicrobiia bacterium]
MLGKLLPFGVAAAFGAGANYMATKSVARHARKFSRQLPAQLQGLAHCRRRRTPWPRTPPGVTAAGRR